jgi:hypothetical protein
VRKSENKVSQERRMLDSGKIRINRDLDERWEKKEREKKGMVNKSKETW